MAYVEGGEFETKGVSSGITINRRTALTLGAGALLGGGELFRRSLFGDNPEPTSLATITGSEDEDNSSQTDQTEESVNIDELVFVEERSFKLDTVVGQETYNGRMSAERLRELVEDEESPDEFDRQFSITAENIGAPEFLPGAFADRFGVALLTGQSPTEVEGRFNEAILSGDDNTLSMAIENYLDEMSDKYDSRINDAMLRVSSSAPTYRILLETLRAARRRFANHVCAHQNLREAASVYVSNPQVSIPTATGRIRAHMNLRFTNRRDEIDPEAYDIEEPASITSTLDEMTGFYTTLISDMPEHRKAFEEFSNI